MTAEKKDGRTVLEPVPVLVRAGLIFAVAKGNMSRTPWLFCTTSWAGKGTFFQEEGVLCTQVSREQLGNTMSNNHM